MKRRWFHRALVCVLCGCLSTPVCARADTLKTDAREIVAGIFGVAAAIGVGVGVGVYFALHPTLKGCVSKGPNGLEITNDKDQAVYELMGDTTALTAGEIVSVRGRKKSAKGGSSTRLFRVDKVKKTWGACAASATP